MAFFILLVFLLGYLTITVEHSININKAATALVTGVICWSIYILGSPERQIVVSELVEHLGELSQILFFLMAAMTIVELIDAHDGFEIITKRIITKNKRSLLWLFCFLTFFLSAILDNLTTAIVMMTLVRKLMADKKDRWFFAGAIIIAANAGGAWSPIGDVTTTMLWIGGQVTAKNIVLKLFLPSLVCLVVPLVIFHFSMQGFIQPAIKREEEEKYLPNYLHRNIVFWSGLGIFLAVPVFKTLTGLPPFMGILLGLGVLWIIVEILHSDKDEEERKSYTVAYALRKIDAPSILFFLGILLAIAALQSTGQLNLLATWLHQTLKHQQLIVFIIGLLSAVVDNVPLVAASMGMYPLQHYPADSSLWTFLAYCSGTGGSALIIGSAAGVAVMGIEKINFLWYAKRIGWIAIAGYFSGAAAYLWL